MILYKKISPDPKARINDDDVNKFQPENVEDAVNHNRITNNRSPSPANNHQHPPSYFRKVGKHVHLIVFSKQIKFS